MVDIIKVTTQYKIKANIKSNELSLRAENPKPRAAKTIHGVSAATGDRRRRRREPEAETQAQAEGSRRLHPKP